MSKQTRQETMELSADDLALWSAVIVILGDLLALFSLLKARTEEEDSK